MNAKTLVYRQSRTSLLGKALLSLLTGGITALWAAPVALADTPAVTDFGQVETAPVSTSPDKSGQQAVFLTLYPDGRSHSEVRGVTDDSENAMVADHPSWELDHSLTWFVQMPVYVRTLTSTQVSSGTNSV